MPRNDLKAYASLIARIPQDLVGQVKRYAREHRSTVSELIRDGLEMRLGTDLPWPAPGDRRSTESEVLPEVLHALEALTPMLRALVQDTVHATMTEVLQGVLQEVLHRETSRHMAIREVLHEVIPDDDEVIEEVFPSGDQVFHGHTSTLQAPSDSTNGGMTEVIQGHTEVIPQKPTARTARRGITEVLPFDTTRHRLGKLCPRNHDSLGTGQSLRKKNKGGGCLACDAEDARARRQARRQQEVST